MQQRACSEMFAYVYQVIKTTYNNDFLVEKILKNGGKTIFRKMTGFMKKWELNVIRNYQHKDHYLNIEGCKLCSTVNRQWYSIDEVLYIMMILIRSLDKSLDIWWCYNNSHYLEEIPAICSSYDLLKTIMCYHQSENY